MKLIRLKAKNIYSFDKIDIRLDNHVLVQVTGNNLDEKRTVLTEEDSEVSQNVNGVGKTNLYNCIIQALYSRDIYKTKKSFLKNMFAICRVRILVLNKRDYLKIPSGHLIR